MALRTDPLPPMLARVRVLTVGIGVIVTALAVATPFVRLAYRVPGLSPVIDTTNGLVSLLLCTVLFGRARASLRLSDAMLATALAVAGFGNLALSAIPNALLEDVSARFVAWAPALIRLCVAAAFCVASLLPRMRTIKELRAPLLLGASIAFVTIVGVAVGLSLDVLPDPVDPDLDPNSSNRPLLAGHPLTLVIQSLDLALYGTAAANFWRTSVRYQDELLGWLSTASILAAFARLHYLLFPSLYTEWFYTGDLLRLESFGLLLVGAGREIQGYWFDRARVAIDEERRRLSRDIHDGLAQELAFITSRAGSLATREGHDPHGPSHQADALEQLHSAAQRALDESRLAIRALSAPSGTQIDFEAMLVGTTEEIARRHGAEHTATVVAGIHVDDDAALQLIRIAGEAVNNACRHGRTPTVHIVVDRHGTGGRMVIWDEGVGFDPDDTPRRGFGLLSMSERAETLAGTLLIESAPGRGTTIQVTWP